MSPPTVQFRQSYLTATSMGLVETKRAYKAYLRAEERELCCRRLKIAFGAFLLHARGLAFSQRALSAASGWLRDVEVSVARALSCLAMTAARLKASVRADRTAYVQQLADDIRLSDLHDPKRLYAAVRRAFPAARSARRSSFRPLPRGYVAQVALQPGPRDANETVFDVDCVPSLSQVEQLILNMSKGRAAGPDAITAELLQLDTAVAARSLLPLFVKSSLSVHEPVHFKGGHLITLAKRAGDCFQCDAFRSVLISSIPGKILHRFWRGRLLPCLRQVAGPLQHGTFKGISIEALTLYAQSMSAVFSAGGALTAHLFFDVAAAFYRAIRQCIAPFREDDSHLQRLLSTLGMPPPALAELSRHLQSTCELARGGASAHLQAATSALFKGTWFKLDVDVARLVLTRRGTRPGDAAADVLYAFCLSAYLRCSNDALTAAGLQTEMPQLQGLPLMLDQEIPVDVPPASWADDIVRLAAQPDVVTLVQHVSSVAKVCAEQATAAGILLSYAPHKTAALIAAPPAWVRTRGNIAAECPRSISFFNDVLGEKQCLPVVDAYKHLGSIVTANGTPAVELQYRKSLAMGALRPLRYKLYSQPSFPLPARVSLLRALVVSRFVHGSSALLLGAACHRREWCRTYVALWRGLKRVPTVTRQQEHAYLVLSHASACNPLLVLASARASLLKRLLLFGPMPTLFALQRHWEVAPRTSWYGQLEADIKLVAGYVHAAGCHMATSALCALCLSMSNRSLVPGFVWSRRQPGALCKTTEAGRTLVRLPRPRQLVQQWITRGAKSRPLPGETDKLLRCEVCGKGFSLHKHLASHRYKAHGRRSITRSLAPVEWCLACHRFLSVPRVQKHLKQSPTCLLRTAHLVSPLTEGEICQAEATCKGRQEALRKGTWSAYARHVWSSSTHSRRETHWRGV